eukprot:CFRG7750T1
MDATVLTENVQTLYATEQEDERLSNIVVEDGSKRDHSCPNAMFGCSFSGADDDVLADHLDNVCQKQHLLNFIQEREEYLNHLKNEMRFREEELINLKLVLYGDVERDKPAHQIEEEENAMNSFVQEDSSASLKQPTSATLFFKNLKTKLENHKFSRSRKILSSSTSQDENLQKDPKPLEEPIQSITRTLSGNMIGSDKVEYKSSKDKAEAVASLSMDDEFVS